MSVGKGNGMRLLGLLLLGLAGGLWAEPGQDWQMVTDRDGIKVYMAHSDDSKIKTFRGEGEIQADDFRSIANQLDDYPFIASWMHMISELDDLGMETPYDRRIHVTTRLPWPVSDRDAGIDVKVFQDPDSYTVLVPFVARNDIVAESDSYVRMPELEGYLRFEPLEPGLIYMTFEVVLDPGGYIPAWLANLILRDIPYFSLKRLRRVSNAEEFQENNPGYFRIPPGWPGASTSAMVAQSRGIELAPPIPAAYEHLKQRQPGS